MPPNVKDKDRLNLILIGPEKSGKTSVANFLQQEHQRQVIKLDGLFDYCVKRGLPIGEKAQKYLDQRQEELKVALEE
jgi:adenylate kinase family enzyme